MSKEVSVKDIFPIRDRQWLMVHLKSPDWSFSDYGCLVNLCTESEKILMEYLGSGNIGGDPVLVLIPKDTKYTRVEEIYKKLEKKKSEIYLVRLDV